MKKAWAVSKLFINSLFGISSFLNELKTNRKAAIKKILLFLLIVLSFSGMVVMFVMFNITLYNALAPIGQQRIVITNSIVSCIMLTFVFGISSIVATYYLSNEGDIILSLPIEPWHLLTAKFSVNYLYEAIVTLVIMATGFMVYGIKSGAGILFYIISIIVSLFIPILPLVIGYLLIIPIMKTVSITKKKDATMIIAGAIGLVFAIGFQFLNQAITKLQSNTQLMVETFTSQNSYVAVAGRVYYPSIWATYAITDTFSVKGALYLVLFLCVTLLGFMLLLRLLSGIYMSSISMGSEVPKSSKKLNETEFKSSLKSKSKISALLSREIKLMNREPIYLLNGPLVVILMPVILGIVFFMQKNEMAKEFGGLLNSPNSVFIITLIGIGFGAFLGASCNITSTCISREGRAYMVIKSMPVEPVEYIQAKLLHGMLFSMIGSVVSTVIFIVLFKLPVINIVLIFLLSLILSSPVIIGALLLELKWPKLLWDNPQKAMKQNINAVIPTLFAMFLVPGVLAASYFIFRIQLITYIVVFLINILISVLLYLWVINYAKTRFYDIEI